MIDEYYENKEAQQAWQQLRAEDARRQSAEAAGRTPLVARKISVMAPLKSAIFGRWYDDVRPLLRRQLGLKAKLPEPISTEVLMA